MNHCPYQTYIDRYLENTLTHSEQQALQDHLSTCPVCTQAWTQMNCLEEVVKDAIVPGTNVQQAATRVMDRLAEHPVPTYHFPGRGLPWSGLAAMLLVGVVLGMILPVYCHKVTMSKPVPIQVAEVMGTVLVKHQGSRAWQVLRPESPVYLGDRFCSTASSEFVLALKQPNKIEVAQNSMLTLESFDREIQFYLEHGQCTPVLNGPHGPFFIRTPNGRMEALGTEFTVKVTE